MSVSTISKKIRRWRSYNQTVKALSRLDNAQLHDLGIERFEIPRVASEVNV